MLFTEDRVQAQRLADLSLQIMERYQIPANPKNYTLWYTYHTERYPDLTRTLKALLESDTEFNLDRNEELFAKFFGNEQEQDEINQASEELSTLLGDMQSFLGEAGENASQYGEHLQNLVKQVGDASSAEDLRALVGGVLQETHRMEKHNGELERRLGESAEKISDLSERLEDVRRESMTDALTGLANRKCFDQRLREGAAESEAEGIDLCLMMVDIDYFKKFNDTYGHPMGDQVLKLIGSVLSDSVKGRDTPARYGGEEFGIILPRTQLKDALKIAEQIRATVANKKITKRSSGEALGQITLSIGVAQYRVGEALGDFLVRADEALYTAKRSGRNQVISEDAAQSLEAIA